MLFHLDKDKKVCLAKAEGSCFLILATVNKQVSPSQVHVDANGELYSRLPNMSHVTASVVVFVVGSVHSRGG